MLTNLSIGLLWLVAIVQGAIIVALVHQLAALRTIANAGAPIAAKLPVGVDAPEFSALELQSNRPVHSSTFRGRRIVLCFMSADCHVCRALAFELSQKSADTLLGLVIYYDAAVTGIGAVFQALAAKVPVLCKETTNVSAQFGLNKFPVSVVIDESWRIAGTGNPLRADDLLASLAEATEQAQAPAAPLTPVEGQS